ncbi:NAD(P)-binding domain-containing protein [Peribacillus frigoritolerans]|uniref:NAD(P)-binding domain-containing protein n=1 Tax=Peribacillus frigoritolerans TaxID=450367 RepID=UPI003D290F03
MNLDLNEVKGLRVGIIGFGEVGQVFAKGLLEKTKHVFIYDILLEKNKNLITDKINNIGVQAVDGIEQIGECCTLIISLVNSSASEVVAAEVAKGIRKGTVFLDLTTSTPLVKSKSEKIIVSNGGIYVDASIMGTVATEQQQVPLLIAGEQSVKVQALLNSLGFNCQAINHPNGGAASIKLLRSIFMKGLEALILETMITAKNYGVSDEVMQSISKTINNNDFTTFANALITTHVIHKNRRYKEVLDSCNLIKEAGLSPFVTEGVISFFSNSLKMDIDQEVIQSNNVTQILDQYLSMNVVSP